MSEFWTDLLNTILFFALIGLGHQLLLRVAEAGSVAAYFGVGI